MEWRACGVARRGGHARAACIARRGGHARAACIARRARTAGVLMGGGRAALVRRCVACVRAALRVCGGACVRAALRACVVFGVAFAMRAAGASCVRYCAALRAICSSSALTVSDIELHALCNYMHCTSDQISKFNFGAMQNAVCICILYKVKFGSSLPAWLLNIHEGKKKLLPVFTKSPFYCSAGGDVGFITGVNHLFAQN